MTPRLKKIRVLVIDVGGSHVKCLVTGRTRPVRFKSGPTMSPDTMVRKVMKITRGWHFHVVSIGYPGVVQRGTITAEPHNLGAGWLGFDFKAAFGCRVRLINDAAMQALGDYEGGTMLFLGLGTGLGSTLITRGVVTAMELGHLPYRGGRTYEQYVGERARKRHGNKKWRRDVAQVVEDLRRALLPEYIVLGGGNATRLRHLPAQARIGRNANAFAGGFLLWERRRASARPAAAAPAKRGAGAVRL